MWHARGWYGFIEVILTSTTDVSLIAKQNSGKSTSSNIASNATTFTFIGVHILLHRFRYTQFFGVKLLIMSYQHMFCLRNKNIILLRTLN